MTKRQPLLVNLASQLSTRFISRGLRFFYLILLARFLGPTDLGIFQYGFALYVSLLGVGGFGQGVFLSTRLGRYAGRKRLLAHSLTLTIFALLATLVLALVVALFSSHDTRTIAVVAFFLLALIARGIAVWVRQVYIAWERTSWIPRFELIFRGGEVLLGSIGLLLGFGLFWACLIHCLGWVLECVAALVMLTREAGPLFLHGRNMRFIRKIAAASIIITLTMPLLHVYVQMGPVVLRAFDVTLQQIGFFCLAVQLFSVVLELPVSFGQVILPRMSRQLMGSDSGRDELLFLAKVLLLLGVFLPLTGAWLAPWFVPMVFGPDYLDAVKPFVILLWAFGPFSLTVLLVQALNAVQAFGKAASVAISTVGILCLAAVFIPSEFALTGISLAMVAGALGGAVICMVHAHSSLSLPVWRGKFIIIYLMFMAATYFCKWRSSLFQLLLLVVFLISVWAIKVFSKEEWRLLLKPFVRMKRDHHGYAGR